ncbi:MAG: retention module-containing protein [Betaproteobacteria bacterium]|nr:retention module-containing protein [Betaproteobacteria bacterium]
MAQATVTAVTGNAVIVKADGTTRALQVGEVVQRGDVIRTQNGARVELLLADGQTLAMGPNQALRVDETVALTDATPQAADAAVQATTVAEIVQILEQGLDLLEQIDPAAAGAVAAGAGEGSDFVRLLRVAEPVEPLAFQFNLGAADTTDEIEGEPAPVTIDLSFELEEESALGLDGNDETDDGLSASRSGNFLTGVGGVLTSFSVPGLGFIAIAPGGSTLAFDANGQVIPPGATTPPSVLLTVQPNGDYTLTVVGPLNHPTPGTVEELLSLSPIALIGTAGTGGFLTINLAISVADDVPAAILGEDAGPRVDTALLDEDALQGGNADGNPLRPGEFNAGGSAIANGDIVDNVSWGADGFGRVTSVSWNGGSVNLAANATSATVYILASGGLGDPANAAIRLTVGADGSYSFELLRAQTHGESGEEDYMALLEGGFTFNAVDRDGDAVAGGVRVNVNVRDDIPVITYAEREREYFDDAMPSNGDVPMPYPPFEPGAVTVDESAFDADGQSAPGTVHFSVSFGADGPATGGGKLYVLEAFSDAPTGLTDTASGQPVVIAQGSNGQILGVVTVNSVQQTVFVMSVNPSTGVVGFDQQRAVVHGNAQDPNDRVSIAQGIINLRLTATDGDGDAVSATVDVGRLVSIADDGPSIDVSRSEAALPTLAVDESNLALNATGNFAGLFAVSANAGADGEGSRSSSYGLGVNTAIASGVVDVASGQAVTLVTDGTTVRGQVTIGTSVTDVFTLSVNAQGEVTLDQLRALRHADASNPNDSVSLAAGAVTLTRTDTLIDGDDDQASDSFSIEIGNALSFADDGPSIAVSPTQNLRESFEGFVTTEPNQGGWFVVGENGRTLVGNDGIVWTLNEAGIEIQRGNVGGAAPSDGAHKAELDAHNLAGGSANTLTELSTQIYVPGSTFEMSFDYQPRPAAMTDSTMTVTLGAVVVAISADAQGVLSISAPSGVTATTTPGTNGWSTINLSFANVTPGLNTLSFAGTGSANSLGAYIDNIRMAANNPILVDETRLGDDGSANAGALRFSVDFGADGAAASNARVFDLTAANGAPTGLTDTASGQPVVIAQGSNGQILGVVTVNNVQQTVFVMSVDAETGVVSFDQQRAVVHGDALDPDDSVSIAQGVIELRLTATDGDGDTVSATVDVGSLVSIADDGPRIDVSLASPDAQPLPVLTTQDAETIGAASDTATGNFAGLFAVSANAGADGEASRSSSYSLSVGIPATGLSSGGQAISLFAGPNGQLLGSTAAAANLVTASNTVFEIGVNASTGQVTLTQHIEIDHAVSGSLAGLPAGTVLLSASSTITDGDGDQASDSATRDISAAFKFEDGTPPVVSISARPATVDEDGAAVITFTVSQDRVSVTDTVVTISLTGTATENTDYAVTGLPAGQTRTVTILAGQSSVSFTADPTPDILDENNPESVTSPTKKWQFPIYNKHLAQICCSPCG